ncbi:MAG: glycogen debranching protein GlgX [Micrococcales bacterium]
MSENVSTFDLVNPNRMGVTFASGKGTIRVYSENAESIEICILENENPRDVRLSVNLAKGVDNIWEASLSELKPGTKYALRAAGPKGPRHGFNEKLFLIDPYAKAVARESAREYHCVAISEDFDWQGVSKPKVPMDQTIIYEAHARGLTRGNSALPDEIRGTYAALGHESTIEHLTKIGVTSVELLPIQMFISEPRLMNMGLINYWGYNTINFFSAHPRYASPLVREKGPEHIVNELKTAIRELHRAGIEVILDVVYNHTAEGGGGGLTYSFRGLDASSYYRQDDHGNYHDTTGCGNSLNFSNPHVVNLTLDSLRYWTEVMQIDGFRFDLATTLARDVNNQYDRNHPLFQAIRNDPILSKAKMIVEPWDVGLGGWQTGNFPDGFQEWNDRYRDSVRKFWLTDISNARNSGKHWNGVADLATRLAGSNDVVNGPLGPLGSINFITAHDGFTAHDLVSYNVKHNQINGESNRDGAGNNYSFNHGAEGESSDPTISSLRRKAVRNLLGTLLFSAGVPMVTAGDERGKTQLGNNNAYCQDSNLSWVNWELTRTQRDLEATFAHLTKLRRENPVLRPNHFGSFEKLETGTDRIRWFNASGGLMTEEDWNNSETRTVARFSEHLEADGSTNRVLLLVHGSETATKVVLPSEIGVDKYEVLWNSAHELPAVEFEVVTANQPLAVSGTSIQVLRAI